MHSTGQFPILNRDSIKKLNLWSTELNWSLVSSLIPYLLTLIFKVRPEFRLWFNLNGSLVLDSLVRRSLYIWRSTTSGSGSVQKRSWIEIMIRKIYNLTRHLTLLISLVLYFDLRSPEVIYIWSSKNYTIIWGKKGPRDRIGTPKAYDLIPNMTYFHRFHILTSEGHWYLEVNDLKDHVRSKKRVGWK